MAGSVIADFPGRFYSHQVTGEPPTGRILLNKTQLVVAAEEFKEQVPVSHIFDIRVGDVPQRLQRYFSDTVTVAYSQGDTQRIIAIEADDEHIERFSTILFKLILNGTTTAVTHPERKGGRVTNANPVTATLDLQWEEVGFKASSSRLVIQLDDVISVSRSTDQISGEQCPLVRFRHAGDKVTVTTSAAIRFERKLNLLGRYIRLRFDDVEDELADLQITEPEQQVLVALYSTSDASLSDLIDLDSTQLQAVISTLREKELLVESQHERALTIRGKIVADKRLKQ